DDKTVGGSNYGTCAAEILGQRMLAASGIAIREREDVTNIRSTPSVDCLVVIPNYEKTLGACLQFPNQLFLYLVDVLVFVDHQVLQRLYHAFHRCISCNKGVNDEPRHQGKINKLIRFESTI